MIWQQTPYTVPLIIASALSIALSLYIVVRRPSPRIKVGVLIVLANSEWMLTYALELASADLATKVFWDKVQFLGVVTVPTAWLGYILYYTGHEKWLTRRSLVLLPVIPFITLLLTFTNEHHWLIWTSYTLDTSGPFSVLHNTYGLWLWIFIGYAYILILIGASLLIKMFIHSRSLYRWQTGTLLFSALIPLIASALVAFGLNPSEYLDLTPFFFIPTNVIVGLSVAYFRLEDIVPLAREIVIESMSDSVIVVDAQNRIVDVNPSAEQLAGSASSHLIGNPLELAWPDVFRQIELGINTGKKILLDHAQEKRVYDVSISSLADWSGRSVGQVIVLRDITERKQSEEIRASLKEKEVLLREIHHRVKNNMQIMSSLLSLQSRHIKDKKYAEMLKESQNRIKSMALVHEKLYQSENLAKINFGEYIEPLVQGLVRSYGVDAAKVGVKIEVEDVSLSIDASIPCGLIINELVSNALKHAFSNKREGEIKITFHSVGDNVELIVSDNGIGIPDTIDFKTTHSLGLHLVTILAEDQLEGEITLDKSEGTTFTITFEKGF